MKKFAKQSILATISALLACATGAATKPIQAERWIPPSVGHPIEVIKNPSPPKPTVIVLHGCNGLNAFGDHYRESAEQYAGWGYNVVLIDSYTRRGYTNICDDSPTNRVWPESRAQDVSRAISYIKASGWHEGGIAVVGFDQGGSAVLNLAGNPTTNTPTAGVALHPDCRDVVIERSLKDPKFPVQIHIGSKDDWSSVHDCKTLAHPRIGVFIYEGATHWFDVRLGPRTYLHHRLEHHEQSTETANRRIKSFLSDQLDP